MAMYYSTLRRASSSLAQIAARALGSSSRTFHGVISSVEYHHQILHGKTFLPSSFHNFTTAFATKPSSDASLLGIISSEINYVEENEDHDCLKIPNGFPFTIEDKPGERTIFLKRDHQNETIEVLVDMPNPEAYDDEEEKGADGKDGGDDTEIAQCSIPLVVGVSKPNGFRLEFGVTASPDAISIDSLSIKTPGVSEDQIAYEGPDFSDLDEDLQNAFLKYLETRGIKPSTTNVILEYMINKDHKEYLMWLKNLKSVIEY